MDYGVGRESAVVFVAGAGLLVATFLWRSQLERWRTLAVCFAVAGMWTLYNLVAVDAEGSAAVLAATSEAWFLNLVLALAVQAALIFAVAAVVPHPQDEATVERR